jgi:hypothetical protein
MLKADVDAWTLRAWPKANTLTPADGDKVRQAFLDRLTRSESSPDADVSSADSDSVAVSEATF